jgi:hypothetical protein
LVSVRPKQPNQHHIVGASILNLRHIFRQKFTQIHLKTQQKCLITASNYSNVKKSET